MECDFEFISKETCSKIEQGSRPKLRYSRPARCSRFENFNTNFDEKGHERTNDRSSLCFSIHYLLAGATTPMDDVRLFTPNVWNGISSRIIDNWLRSDDVSQFSCHPMDNLLLVDRKLRRNSSDIVKLAIGDRA